MSNAVPEVIAYLDRLESEIRSMADRVREVRHTLFETLDTDPDTLVE